MDTREHNGLLIAATRRITKKGSNWIVPSQSGNGRYCVCPDKSNPRCTCQDFETNHTKCKHIFAVEFAQKRERNTASCPTPNQNPEAPKEKPSRLQIWTTYNRAQTNEKDNFLFLLRDLCRDLRELPYKTGRPRMPIADALFTVCFKIYSTFSGRRFISDLRAAQEKGYVQTMPHFNSISNYLENPALTPILNAMIVETSLPLKTVDVDFAVDSSGFKTSRFDRWYDHKYGSQKQHDWAKVHLVCGVKTNVVTAVKIAERDAHDSPQLPELVKQTAENFTVKSVSGDKAYSSYKNLEMIAAMGATPFIMFKSNATSDHGGIWSKMFHYFSFKKDEFLAHYHKRSNVESTFSMIKAKFRDHVRSKTDVAMTNEVLCKIVCHNICCVIQQAYELGVEPAVWPEAPKPIVG